MQTWLDSYGPIDGLDKTVVNGTWNLTTAEKLVVAFRDTYGDLLTIGQTLRDKPDLERWEDDGGAGPWVQTS